jgi:hypothetical protein
LRRQGSYRYGYGLVHGSYGYEPYSGYGDDESASHGRIKRPALLAAESAETLVPDKENFGGLID